jgi:hypothetical protein
MTAHLSILLVEDSPGECEMFREALTQAGASGVRSPLCARTFSPRVERGFPTPSCRQMSPTGLRPLLGARHTPPAPRRISTASLVRPFVVDTEASIVLSF